MMNPNTVASHHPQFNPVAYEQQQQPKPVRPKPAAAAKGKKSAEAAPIFLRKTFHMIDSCDPTIASWSKDGLSFVVKDTDKFAAEIIGQFFKHNNFSSFVRQLNFYGFRKIKSDPLRIRDADSDVESKYWKFRHEKFQRGRPDLLGEIRKSNHTEAADKEEVNQLKSEVNELRARMVTMNQEMEKMATLVAGVMQQSHHKRMQPYAPHPDPNAVKKRRMNNPADNYLNDPIMPIPVGSTVPNKPQAIGDDLMPLNVDFAPTNANNPRGNLTAAARNPSVSSFTSTDEQMLSSLFALESSDDVSLVREPKQNRQNFQFPEVKKERPGEPDEALMKKLRTAISVLPKNLQEMFVDRIVSFMTNPESFKRQVDAVSSLAAAAAAEATQRVGSGAVDANQSNALASAALGAWLAKYGTTTTSNQTTTAPLPAQAPAPTLSYTQTPSQQMQPQQMQPQQIQAPQMQSQQMQPVAMQQQQQQLPPLPPQPPQQQPSQTQIASVLNMGPM